MSQSTLYDSQQTIKDMPDSMDYYTARYEKHEFQLNCEKHERQDVSHFITPRVLPQQILKIATKILPPTPMKRKRSMELNIEDIEEVQDKKADPFYFDDIECDDELDAKSKVVKILFPPMIKRTSLVLFEVK